MSPRQRAWRRRLRRNRGARFALGAGLTAAAVAAAVASMALVDDHLSAVNQAAYGNCAPVAAQASAAPAGDPSAAPATPCPSQPATASSPSAAVVRRVAVAPDTFATGPVAQQRLGDVATDPVDGQGDPISLHQTPDEASDSGNCTLTVPPDPLTAAGLATPYRLADGCSEANPDEQAFVEATILSPSGQVQVYNPLVITQGTRPAAAVAAPPRIPRGAKVILDFGFNGTNLVLTGPGARQPSSGCVDALGQSLIGQVAACDAVPFYLLADAEITRGTLKVPVLGTATDGEACQTTRDFALVDQDPSDNIYSQYLLNGRGQTAQATAANRAALRHAALVSNGSDNALLGYFVDPANGCKPFTSTDRTGVTGTQSSQALDELSARVNQKAPVAVIPTNDEMVLVGGAYSIAKTNMYRSLVDQPQLAANTNAYQVAAAFCMNLVNHAPAHDQLDLDTDQSWATPVPDVGDNLATFLGNRLSMSFANLGCDSFGLTDPVDVTADGDGVATAVGYNTAQQQATLPAAEAGRSTGPHRAPSQGHDRRHRVQDPSGM